MHFYRCKKLRKVFGGKETYNPVRQAAYAACPASRTEFRSGWNITISMLSFRFCLHPLGGVALPVIPCLSMPCRNHYGPIWWNASESDCSSAPQTRRAAITPGTPYCPTAAPFGADALRRRGMPVSRVKSRHRSAMSPHREQERTPINWLSVIPALTGGASPGVAPLRLSHALAPCT